MLFNSFTYLLFLPIVVALHWLLPRAFRRGLLLLASYFFYMSWMPAYGLLIFGLTVANYFFALAIAHFTSQRKPILIAGLVFNLGSLCFFKYTNFLLNSLWLAAGWSHKAIHWPPDLVSTSPTLNIILPLGISFFTFEFIHYIVDVYRGSKPLTNFWHFSLFAAFFPSQIAGPIKRFQDFNCQLHQKVDFSKEKFQQGLSLIFLGLFKKMVLSDNLGRVVGIGFAHPAQMGAIDAWVSAAGFTLQIFLDFSGYTDVGRGSALLLGYKLPENFNWPFLSANLNEFWRRWHISLSPWLRDYLFIPLGGSRVSSWKVKRNLFITMSLGGLWHGAAWHYVIWGIFHGTGLVLTKDWLDLVEKTPVLKRCQGHFLWHWSGVALTFLFVAYACILFRAQDLPQAGLIMQRMFQPALPGAVWQALLNSTLPVSGSIYAMFLWASRRRELGKNEPDIRLVSWLSRWWQTSFCARATGYACLALIILGFAPEDVAPFIYFQF